LLSILFIILAARFDLESFQAITTQSYYFLAILILVIRPISVAISAIPASLNWREIGALSLLAPRGLVAAAMSALFALKLSELGYAQARQIDAEIFFLICGTVAVYGIISPKLLDWLGVTTDANAEDTEAN
jgi:NhaP-type Na+/H+ or K+/H+ antiporter